MNFQKTHTPKDLTISVALIALGAGLYFLNAALGILIAVCGILMLLLYKDGYKTAGRDIVLKKKTLDLNKSCRTSLVDFLNGKDVEPQVVPGNEGGTVQLEVWYNESQSVAYARLSDFTNYTYETTVDTVEIPSARAAKLISKL